MAGGNVPAQVAPIIRAAAAANRIPAPVLAGIASVESNFGANQGPSSAGAVGPMQFLPSTARGIGVSNPYDWRQAVFGAAKLLNSYGFQQNPTRAIAAYNAGPGNVAAGMGYAQQVLSEARRLGPQLGSSGGGGMPGLSAGGASPASGAGGTISIPYQQQVFDQAGYKQARDKSIAGQALQEASSSANPYSTTPGASKGFAQSLGPDSSGLFAKGLLTTASPNPQDFASTQTKMLQVATGQLQQLAGQPLVNVHQGAAGDVNPIPGAVIGRTDMGVDANLKPGAPIVAPNDAKVVAVLPNWYRGQKYVALQILRGSNAGKVMYVAEQITEPPAVGTVVRRGQPIVRYASSGTGIEIGWANPKNPTQTLAQATTGYTEGQQTQAGSNFRSYLGGL